jgi:hypothetical protein
MSVLFPSVLAQRSRKIPLYKKAKWENIKDKLKIIKEEIEKMYLKGNSTQEFWDYFKKELEDRIDEQVLVRIKLFRNLFEVRGRMLRYICLLPQSELHLLRSFYLNERC